MDRNIHCSREGHLLEIFSRTHIDNDKPPIIVRKADGELI